MRKTQFFAAVLAAIIPCGCWKIRKTAPFPSTRSLKQAPQIHRQVLHQVLLAARALRKILRQVHRAARVLPIRQQFPRASSRQLIIRLSPQPKKMMGKFPTRSVLQQALSGIRSGQSSHTISTPPILSKVSRKDTEKPAQTSATRANGARKLSRICSSRTATAFPSNTTPAMSQSSFSTKVTRISTASARKISTVLCNMG